MTVEQAINQSEGDARWGRARTDSAFQSTGSVVGPSAGLYFNPNNETLYSPVFSGAADSGLTPTFGTFGVLRPIPATQVVHDNWSPIVGLPGADLSSYSLQAHRGTQVAHGNISFDSYWDRRQENNQPQYARASLAEIQAQAIGLQLATGTYGRIDPVPYSKTPLPSVAEGSTIVGRTLSNATNRPRPAPRLPPINIDVANNKYAFPQSVASSASSEPSTALFSPASDSINFTNPFMDGVSSGLKSPVTATSPYDQATFTPHSASRPSVSFANPLRTPQTPNRRRRMSSASQEKLNNKDLNKEEKDFIVYLSLQGIHNEAVGLELGRLTGEYSNIMGIDRRGKVMGRRVTTYLKSLSKSKGTGEDAERLVSQLMTRAEREGWSEGVLARAKDYSHTLSRGKSIASDTKDRKYDARCRAAHKKWRINNPEDLPREDAKNKDEIMAFRGMLLEDTAQEVDGADGEVLKKNLLELWESGTIGGKALK